MPTPQAIAILAGGRSTRMGRDKLQLRLGGKPLLEIVRERAVSLGLPVHVIDRDDSPGLGPLGGMQTAFRRAPSHAILCLTGDMPFVSAGLMRAVWGEWSPDSTAVFSADAEGRFGFPAVLAPGAAGVIDRQIAAERLSVKALVAALAARTWTVPEAFQPELFNVNTPKEFEEACRRWDKTREAPGKFPDSDPEMSP